MVAWYIADFRHLSFHLFIVIDPANTGAVFSLFLESFAGNDFKVLGSGNYKHSLSGSIFVPRNGSIYCLYYSPFQHLILTINWKKKGSTAQTTTTTTKQIQMNKTRNFPLNADSVPLESSLRGEKKTPFVCYKCFKEVWVCDQAAPTLSQKAVEREREREFTERSSNSTHSHPAKLKAVSKTDDKLL